MTSKTPFPTIPRELLGSLDKLFPLRSPNIEASDRQVWIEVGWRQVISFMQAEFDRQNTTVLTKVLP